MYKIAICDDSPADTLYLQGLVSNWAKKIGEMMEVICRETARTEPLQQRYFYRSNDVKLQKNNLETLNE